MKYFYMLFVLCVLSGNALSAGSSADTAARAADNRDGTYTLRAGELSITVNALIGGRITSLRWRNAEILSGRDTHPFNFGSTLWPAPQSKWNWPPPAVLDSKEYEAVLTADTLVLKSARDNSTGLQFEKRIFPGHSVNSFIMDFTIRNISTQVQSIAPWQITRLRKGAMVFFPKGSTPVSAKNFDLVPLEENDGIMCFCSRTEKHPPHLLSRTDGAEGWVAALVDSLLFVKSFTDIQPEGQAPGEGEVLLYSSGESDYIEMEVQGPYKAITPGEKLTWTISWYADCIGGKDKQDLDKIAGLVRHKIKR